MKCRNHQIKLRHVTVILFSIFFVVSLFPFNLPMVKATITWEYFTTTFGNWCINTPRVSGISVIISLGGGYVHYGSSMVVIDRGDLNIWNENFTQKGFDVVTNVESITYNVACRYINYLAEYLKEAFGYKRVYLFGYSAGGYAVAYEITSTPTGFYNSDFELWSGGQLVGWNCTGIQNSTFVHSGTYSVQLSGGQEINRTITRSDDSAFRVEMWINVQCPNYWTLNGFAGLKLEWKRLNGSVYMATFGYDKDSGGIWWRVYKDGVFSFGLGYTGYRFNEWMIFQLSVHEDRVHFMWNDQWEGQDKGTYSIAAPYFDLTTFNVTVCQSGTGYNSYIDDVNNGYRNKYYDGVVFASANVDWSAHRSDLWHSLDFAADVNIPTSFICGVDDNIDGEHFYSIMQAYYDIVKSEKEWHSWNDEHSIFSNTEVSTGKSVSDVVESFFYKVSGNLNLVDSLTLALAYLDRSYTQFNDTYAAMKDLPGLPFTLYDRTDNKWLCPAKKTQAVTDGNDGPDWGYYGGCIIEYENTGIGTGGVELRYRWDTEYDRSYDGVVMYVLLLTLDNVNMTCYATIESKADSDVCDLYFNSEKVIDGLAVNSDFSRVHAYGWWTTRFVVRHATKAAANMYGVLGETAKATKLLNMWYGSGYDHDAYDGVWAASNSYTDYTLNEYNDVYYPWAANMLEMMADYEVWGNIPWFQMNQTGTLNAGVPYRSQLHNAEARVVDFVNINPLTGVSLWQSGFTFKLSWACHLLNKYGSSDTAKLAEAKAILDEVSWNGLGINKEVYTFLGQRYSLYSYACYVSYAAGMYLTALSKYYELTGDEWYGLRADEVAGILLKVQVQSDGKIKVNIGGTVVDAWRPDNIGGFMCGYKYSSGGGGDGGGFNFGTAPWELSDMIFNAMAWEYGAYQGMYQRDLPELSAGGWTNSETTLFCYAGLWHYSKLIGKDGNPRTPLTATTEFSLSVFGSTPSTTHSDLGCDRLEADDSGTIRTALRGTIYGETWATVTYRWTIELPSLTNFRTKLAVFIPYQDASGGNAVERWVVIYDYVGTLIAYDYDKILNGVGGYGESYVVDNAMTPIDELDAGTYTVKLKFRFSCGGFLGAAGLYVGYEWYLLPTEPMHIDTFGYDADIELPPQTPTYYVHIRSSGPGIVYPYGEFLIDEGTIIDPTAFTLNNITEYNHATTGESQSFADGVWYAQTFTTTTAYNITAAKLWLYRTGPAILGTVTVGLRDTSGGVPTSGDLASGTLDGNSLTIEPSGAWYTINFSAYYSASVNHTYAIVVRASDAGYYAFGEWKYDNTNPCPNGNGFKSINSSSTWTSYASWDFDFEVLCSPSVQSYFWFWIINNTVLGTSYTRYCPLETLNLPVNYDYNVTAYFGNVSYSIKDTYPLTIFCDMDMNGKIDMVDMWNVAVRYGKVSTQSDWESSLSKAIDILLDQNNRIEMIDMWIIQKAYGDMAP